MHTISTFIFGLAQVKTKKRGPDGVGDEGEPVKAARGRAAAVDDDDEEALARFWDPEPLLQVPRCMALAVCPMCPVQHATANSSGHEVASTRQQTSRNALPRTQRIAPPKPY